MKNPYAIALTITGCIGILLCTILGGGFGIALGLIVGWLTLPYIAYLLIPREDTPCKS